jgi:hypothetical protein
MVYVFKRRRLFGKELRPNWIKITLVFGEPIYPPEPQKSGKLPKEDLARMSETAASWMEGVLAAHHKEKPA